MHSFITSFPNFQISNGFLSIEISRLWLPSVKPSAILCRTNCKYSIIFEKEKDIELLLRSGNQTGRMTSNANPPLLPEIGPDGLPREAPIIAYTEKIIEEEKLQLKKYIEENYTKIRDVEREFANLSLELKLTAGSKNAAFEHLRKKIEVQNEKIRAAKVKEEQAKKVWEDALKVVQDEEVVKQKLCEDLNQLVQESSNSQFTRLEELKRRLEALNPGRASTSVIPTSMQTSASPTAVTQEVIKVAAGAPSQGNGENIPTIGSENQPAVVDGEGRGKKKTMFQGRGKGIGALSKGRGHSTPGWTGAGFDVDSRS